MGRKFLRYQHDVDKTMTQLHLIGANNQPLGAISWFAVHPTSMNNTNRLVSSDNVGYASILLEQEMNKGALIGKVTYVPFSFRTWVQKSIDNFENYFLPNGRITKKCLSNFCE